MLALANSWGLNDCLEIDFDGCQEAGNLLVLHDFDPHVTNGANERLLGFLDQLLVGGCSIEMVVRRVQGSEFPTTATTSMPLQHGNVSLSWDDLWLSKTFSRKSPPPSIMISTLWFWQTILTHADSSSAPVPSIPSLVNGYTEKLRLTQVKGHQLKIPVHITLADDIHHLRLKESLPDAKLRESIEMEERSVWKETSLTIFMSQEDEAEALSKESGAASTVVPLSFRTRKVADRMQVRDWEEMRKTHPQKCGFCGPFNAANALAIEQLLAVNTSQARTFWIEKCDFHLMCDDGWEGFVADFESQASLGGGLQPSHVKFVPKIESENRIATMHVMLIPGVVGTVGYSWEILKAIEFGVPFVASNFTAHGIPFESGCEDIVLKGELSLPKCLGLFVPQEVQNPATAQAHQHLDSLILQARRVLEDLSTHAFQQQVIARMRPLMSLSTNSNTMVLHNGKIVALLKHVAPCADTNGPTSCIAPSSGEENACSGDAAVDNAGPTGLRFDAIETGREGAVPFLLESGGNGPTLSAALQIDRWARRHGFGYWKASYLLSICCLHPRSDCDSFQRLPEITAEFLLQKKILPSALAVVEEESAWATLVVEPLEEPADAVENFARKAQARGYDFNMNRLQEVLAEICKVKECLRLSSQLSIGFPDGAFGQGRITLTVEPWEDPADVVEEHVQTLLHGKDGSSIQTRLAQDEDTIFSFMEEAVRELCKHRICKRTIANVIMETEDVGPIVVKPWEDPADAFSRTFSTNAPVSLALWNAGERRLQALWSHLCGLKPCKKELSCGIQTGRFVCSSNVRPPIQDKETFEVLGMYNTGTHYLQGIIKRNCDGAAIKTLGWKHRFPPDQVTSKTIIVTKHPATWVNSLRRHPYECLWSKRIMDDVITCASDDNCSVIRTFPTVMEWWNTQNRGYASLLGKDNVMIVRYEDLIREPEDVLSSICSFLTGANSSQRQGIEILEHSLTYWKDDSVNLSSARTKYLAPDAHIRALSGPDYDVFVTHIDASVANTLGYSLREDVDSGLL